MFVQQLTRRCRRCECRTMATAHSGINTKKGLHTPEECAATINGFTFGCGAHVSYISFRLHCAPRTYYCSPVLLRCPFFFFCVLCFVAFVQCRQIRLCAFRVFTMENVFRNFCSVPLFCCCCPLLLCPHACVRTLTAENSLNFYVRFFCALFFSHSPFFRRAIYCLFGLPTTMECTQKPLWLQPEDHGISANNKTTTNSPFELAAECVHS